MANINLNNVSKMEDELDRIAIGKMTKELQAVWCYTTTWSWKDCFN